MERIIKSGLILPIILTPLFAYTPRHISQEVMLLPTRPGLPSKIIPYSMLQEGAEYLLKYDKDEVGYYLTGLGTDETLGVWFQSPAKCSLMAIIVVTASVDDTSQLDYKLFAAYVDQDINYAEDFDEYHGEAPKPGPSFIKGFIEGPTPSQSSPGEWKWDTLKVSSQPDMGRDIFFAGWIKPPGAVSPNPAIDPNVSPPYHTLRWRAVDGVYGWYSSWHHIYVRALVKVYENLPPDIPVVTKLPDTYYGGPRKVMANVADLIGVPMSLRGVKSVVLKYQINSGDVVSREMTRVSGDSLEGSYEAWLPSARVGDTIRYGIVATDYQDESTTTDTLEYIIRTGGEGNMLLLLESDAYYGYHKIGDSLYFYDPLQAIGAKVDVWDEGSYGSADASVLNFYNTGYGANIIFWVTWSGASLAANTDFLRDFLDRGGKLFICGQDIFASGFGYAPETYGEWVAKPEDFAYEYLKVRGGYDDYYGGIEPPTECIQYGAWDDPITGVPELQYITVSPLAWYRPEFNYAGRFDSLSPGCEPLFYDPFGALMGYRYQDPVKGYKIVVLYWPFHDINMSGTAIENREAQEALARNILEWFGDPLFVKEKRAEPIPTSLLYQNLPNPFSRSTSIRYSIAKPQKGCLRVYDISGSLVRTLLDGVLKEGTHTIHWDGCDNQGRRVGAGIYFYRLETEDSAYSKKMVLIR